MKEALVVGGSNGIGLSVVKKLICRGYFVYIIDIAEPDKDVLNDSYHFKYYDSNLLYFDDELFTELSLKENLDFLFVSAGFGRVADFEYFHEKEIENMMSVNATALIKIIKVFYHRIKDNKRFYAGVMGSIAGLISSPAFAVYSASKAAVCRFIESINIELKVDGYSNRVLNISPGSIKGTRFNGGENDINETEILAGNIIDNIYSSNTIYIPEYDEVYKPVLKRYYDDPEKFGESSYKYKKESGRIKNCAKVKIGYLSGTFDLFHVGHLNLLEKSKKFCDYLIVGVHPDASHKGKETFISFEERKRIVASCKYVDRVVQSTPEDSDAWELYHYNRLFVGSDYKGTERFKRYEQYFKDKAVEIIYFPYTNGTSSTQLRKRLS
jgi:glycerol-3-phosphate cytidylyltransferase